MNNTQHGKRPHIAILLSFVFGLCGAIFGSMIAQKLKRGVPIVEPKDKGDEELPDLRVAQAEMESVLQNRIVRCMADPEEHPEQAHKLSEAQRAWATFLEAHMAAVYPEDRELGAAAELRKAEVRAELIRARTRQLREGWE